MSTDLDAALSLPALPRDARRSRTLWRLAPLGGLVALMAAGGLPCHWVQPASAQAGGSVPSSTAGPGGIAGPGGMAEPRGAGTALIGDPAGDHAAHDAHDAHDATAEVAQVRITLAEWRLTPSTVQVAAGQTVRFLAANTGVLAHALAVEGDGLYAESDIAGPGETVPLDVTFAAAGTYDIYCPVAAGQHRALGQEGTVLVTATGVAVGDGAGAAALDGDAAGQDESSSATDGAAGEGESAAGLAGGQ